MMRNTVIPAALFALTALVGCHQQDELPPAELKLTFDHGAQLLAAGNPKSAISFLTQTVTSMPDGPEPVALLALAYALDLQDDRAIRQAALVQRAPGEAPGWEFVALGIAQMNQHLPQKAIATLQHGIAAQGPQSPIASAATQWLALAQVLAGEDDRAIDTLQTLAHSTMLRTTATLWSTLIHAHHGRTKPACESLARCADQSVTGSGKLALQRSLVGADYQTLYDAAIAATAQGDLDTARRLFASVQEESDGGGDVAVWIAMITAARGDWLTSRRQLKDACETGPAAARGIAHQLFSVIAALEDRPDVMIEHMLAGQRILGRAGSPVSTVNHPSRETVWSSDSVH